MDRRTLLTRIVQAFSITGLGFVSYPFIRSFLPDAGSQATLEVNVGAMRPGESKIVSWLGRRIYIARVSDAAVNALKEYDSELKDPDSDKSDQPVFAKNRYRSRKPGVFVAFANCTHLGCEVSAVSGENKIGFECPCHNSKFDPVGRVYKTAVASANLQIPDYQFVSKNIIEFTHTAQSIP